jgi:hypothetical protein
VKWSFTNFRPDVGGRVSGERRPSATPGTRDAASRACRQLRWSLMERLENTRSEYENADETRPDHLCVAVRLIRFGGHHPKGGYDCCRASLRSRLRVSSDIGSRTDWHNPRSSTW